MLKHYLFHLLGIDESNPSTSASSNASNKKRRRSKSKIGRHCRKGQTKKLVGQVKKVQPKGKKSSTQSVESREDGAFVERFKIATGRSRMSSSEIGEMLSKKGSIMSTVKRKLSLRKSSTKLVPNEVVTSSKDFEEMSSIAFSSNMCLKEKTCKIKRKNSELEKQLQGKKNENNYLKKELNSIKSQALRTQDMLGEQKELLASEIKLNENFQSRTRNERLDRLVTKEVAITNKKLISEKEHMLNQAKIVKDKNQKLKSI